MGGALFAATVAAARRQGLAFYRRMAFRDHGVSPNIPLKDGTLGDRIHKRFSLEG